MIAFMMTPGLVMKNGIMEWWKVGMMGSLTFLPDDVFGMAGAAQGGVIGYQTFAI